MKDVAKIVRLTGPRALTFQEEALAPCGPGQLRCETIVSAISPGTELAAYIGRPPLRPGNMYPRLQGYCNVGRVAESRTEGFEVGDRVLTFQSHRSAFVIEANDVLVKLPQNGDAGALACSYLYHLGYNSVLRSNVRVGHRVVVIGLGVLGLTTVAMAAIAGADVYGLSDQARPAEIAEMLGARAVFARSEEAALVEAIGAADVVITTVNGWADWHAALRLAAPCATIGVLGFPGRGELMPDVNPLDTQHFYVKQLRIEAVGLGPEANDSRGFTRFNEREDLAWIVGRIASGSVDPSLLISGTYPALQICDAYEALLERKGSPLTFLLDWSEA
jgi:threonine dehydrogenase-like Zn-dependent dehydrogenase